MFQQSHRQRREQRGQFFLLLLKVTIYLLLSLDQRKLSDCIPTILRVALSSFYRIQMINRKIVQATDFCHILFMSRSA